MLSNSRNPLTSSSVASSSAESSSLCNVKTWRNHCLAQRKEKVKNKQNKWKHFPAIQKVQLSLNIKGTQLKSPWIKINPFCLIMNREGWQVTEVPTGEADVLECYHWAWQKGFHGPMSCGWIYALYVSSANTVNSGTYQLLVLPEKRCDVLIIWWSLSKHSGGFLFIRGKKEYPSPEGLIPLNHQKQSFINGLSVSGITVNSYLSVPHPQIQLKSDWTYWGKSII